TDTASVAQNEIDGLRMFPNPMNGNVLNITSNSNNVKAVAIYDVLGKQVFAGNTVNSAVNVNLTAGVYIVKITEGAQSATRKLVVK
ncbi:MAG: T9SS type A sorting domain-containing protein, partial [Flavobacterium sp.]